jgi:mutator protein MutT
LPACLRREIKEELDMHIEVGDLVCTVDHTFTHWHMTLYAFDCRISSGTPHCLACLDLRWVTIDDLDAFAFPVADQQVIAVLRERRAAQG